MKLSIIIPAYNVERQITACIESCSQEKDLLGSVYEIVVVNDGSTDDTAGVLEKLKSRISPLTVISQKNQGLSGARNTGLGIAQGEYVWFVDGDDTIEPKGIKKILNALSSTDALQILGNKVCGEKILTEGNVGPDARSRGIDLFCRGNFTWGAPYTIYRKDFLKKHDLKFFRGIFHEDMEFTPRAYFFAESVASLPERIYNHIHNPKSITQTVNPKRSFDLLTVARRNRSFFKHHKMPGKTAVDIVASNIVASVVLMLDVTSDDVRIAYCTYLKRHLPLLKIMLSSSKFRYKAYGIALLLAARSVALMGIALKCVSPLRHLNFRSLKNTWTAK